MTTPVAGARARSATRASDLVPLAERVGVLHTFRMIMVAVVLGATALWPDILGASLADLAVVCAGYALASVAAEAWRRASDRRGLVVIGGLLLLDGVWLGMVVALTGSPGSLLFFLVVLHVVAVTLLASYRTGLKIAIWHSLLFMAWYFVEEAELLDIGPEGVGAKSAVVAAVVAILMVALGTAFFSSLNERELRRSRMELADLAAMGAELQDRWAPQEVEKVVLGKVRETFGFPRAALVIGDESGLHHLSTWGPEGGYTSHDARGADPGETLRGSWQRRQANLVKRLKTGCDALDAALPEARNLVIAPMVAEGRPVGALLLERGGGPLQGFSVTRRDAVMDFATHGALALRSAYLLAEVERLARVDELTGLANRRAFEETLLKEVERAARTGEELSLVMLDVDHFKRLNDTHGHQRGDEVLRRVGRALASRVRQVDLPARYGGEEFAVVLPGCPAQDAVLIAEQVRQAIAFASDELAVTASAGVATLPTSASSGEDLVRAADEALYESKRAGRDRVTPFTGNADSRKPLAGARR